MSLAAISAPVVSVFDVDAVLDRMSALARSRLQWARRPIKEALRQLLVEPLTDERVDAASEEVEGPMLALGTEFWAFCASDSATWRAAINTDLDHTAARLKAYHTAARLKAYLPSDEGRDTLEWILGFIATIVGLSMALQPQVLAAALESLTDEQRVQVAPWMRGMVAFMAASDGAREEADPARVEELIEYSFLELTKIRNLLRSEGHAVSAFPNETTAERSRRLTRAVENLRDNLSPNDLADLDAARMGNLR